jgi:alpha-tubulin suppressor-like RCC1 family protein
MITTPMRRGRLLAGLLLVMHALAGCLSSAGPEAPTITEQPKDRVGFIGSAVRFDVGVSGKPPMTFQWLRNGQALAGATGITYQTPILTAADDGARFSVRISNAEGSVTSSEATVKVNGPPALTTQPANVSVAAGASASFTVAGTGEALTYQWLRDEVPIAGANAATYTISATTAADDGVVFRAYVLNPAGFVVSNPATLTVTGTPVVAVPPVGQTVVVGEPAIFGVKATGGNLLYQWTRNGVDIPGATTATYRIATTALSDDNASFSVRMTNPQGSVTSAAAVLRVFDGAVAPLAALAAEVSLSRGTTGANSFTLVRRGNGSIAGWGYNIEGQLGNGTPGLASDTPTAVVLPAGRVATAVAAGFNHALALLDNGDVLSWGFNDLGQLGLGDVLPRATPNKVSLPRPAVAVAAGRGFSVVALDDGRVFTWGGNTIGQLGNGGRDSVIVPIQATGLTGIIAVAAGNSHALALGFDGRVWAWGANASGQLGEGSFKPSLVPVVTGLSEIARIRAGGDHSAAVSRRRALYLWGENADGQLGLGAGAPGDLGVPAGVARAAVDVAPGSRMTLLVGSDGLARSTGANDAGSLGDGGTTARNTFGAVSGVSAGITVGAGGLSFAAAITDNGTTFMWGDNGSKQLGNTTITATGTATPTAVPNFDAIP